MTTNISTQQTNYSTHVSHSLGKPASTREYHAFLLRVWCEDENSTWRVQVDNPHTSETFFFSSLESLFIFLDTIIAKEKLKDLEEE